MVAEEIAELERCRDMVNANDSYRLMVLTNRLGKPEFMFTIDVKKGSELIKELDLKIEELKNGEN